MKFDQKFNNESIHAHNKLRKLHGCSPLKLDSNLASESQAYAEELARKNCIKHSAAENYGENIAYKSGTSSIDLNGAEASRMWYSEIDDYDFRHENASKCGHFSQLIWKNTTSAGFGKAVTANGQSVYVVGRYTPAGNYTGQWNENVSKPINGKSTIPDLLELEIETKTNPSELQMSSHTEEGDAILQAQETYRSAIIQAQNEIRQQFGVQSLRENKVLSGMAQRLAQETQKDRKINSNITQYNGHNLEQNVFYSRILSHNPEKIVKSWYKHQRKESNMDVSRNAKHTAQIIGANFTEIGVGAIIKRMPHSSVVICLYSPAGVRRKD